MYSFHQRDTKLRSLDAQAYFRLGYGFQRQEDLEKAVHCYRKSIALNPSFSTAYNNLGVVLQKLNRFDQAIACYTKALSVDPDNVGTYMNLGNLYHVNNMFKKAMDCYHNALGIKPDNSFIHFNMGNTLVSMGRPDDAQNRYKKALELDPSCAASCARLVELMQSACEWNNYDMLSNRLDHLTQSALDNNERPGEYPFLNISRHMDPALNYSVANLWSRHLLKDLLKTRKQYTFEGRQRKKEKLRIGYLSNNFRNHPSALLMVELFEKHNRDNFNICGYSYGKDDGSYYRHHIEKMCDQFVDLRHLDDDAASKKIYSDETDILVDLVGQTEGTRPGICALRPSPIQVRYLGMAGTTGADYFDYIITDQIVTPETDAAFYSEKLVFMPHCYQVNSTRKASSQQVFTRQRVGLPEESFVFCCFNTPYKIDPIIFDVWMNILKRVSVGMLWLMKGSQKVKRNLVHEAENRGVSGERLIFSDKLPIQEHLSRLRLADLALDTRIVTGAASTSDAVWAGIPVITITGGHFASRMSSSILSSMELHELIVDNLKAYEDLAVRLALNPDALAAIQTKLRQNSKISPLFDSGLFVKNMEIVFRAMYENYLAGNEPRPIDVREGDGAV